MYTYTCSLRMTDNVASQNIDASSWDTLYSLPLFWGISSPSIRSVAAVVATFEEGICSHVTDGSKI
jgi:hypothetical protein